MPGQKRHTFEDVYFFVSSRIRQIMQELTILQPQSFCDVSAVRTNEEMCRFLIIAYHDSYFYQSSSFDLRQNTERVTMILSNLMESYTGAST